MGEGLGVGLIVVGLTVFPHAEEDADPFEGEGAEGGVAAGARGAFGFVEGFGPGAPASGVVGEFVEGLPEKLGTGAAGLDRLRLPALLGDGCDTGLVLEFLGRLVALAVGAEGDDQPRDEGGSGP